MLVTPTTHGQQIEHELSSGWQCLRADVAAKSKDRKWMAPGAPIPGSMPAIVPGTVLTTLLHNGKVPDPFFGFNITRIPDIYESGRAMYTYWFVKDLEEKVSGNEHVFLRLRGVNYACEVYLNGHRVDEGRVEGMYLRHSFDITKFLSKNGRDRLAILVEPPYHVGRPNGGQGGDGTIARNVTNQYVAGWDWIQPIPDRNTGIWDKVMIEKVKGTDIEDVHIITHVVGRRSATDTAQAPATIDIHPTLYNPAATAISGFLSYHIDGTTMQMPVSLPPGRSTIVMPSCTMKHPRLWWPNGMGGQPLYGLNVQFINANGTPGDEERYRVGIREITTSWNTHTQSREIYVNGQRMFVKGTNRILSDAMLRFSPDRYDAEVRYHRDMNVNMIRVWGGGITERPEFYNACDRYGLLVFQDLWASGDCNGRWYDPTKKDDTVTRRTYPDDHSLWLASAADQIVMLRNHPSLALWCGGNEIRPPADILSTLRDSLLPALDGGRYFFEYSNHDSMSLHAHDGPYTIQPDTYFWQHRSWAFNSEVGSIGMGDITSLRRFMPEEHLVPPHYDADKKKWVADTMWKFHKYCSYDSAIEAYGHPDDAAQFARLAQLVNYNQYRALMEGIRSHMWDWYTGVMVWKTQNPWTALVGQMYDVYLDPNACLFGMRIGARPLHIMYDPIGRRIMVANDGHTDQMVTMSWGLSRGAKLGQEASIGRQDMVLVVPADTCVPALSIAAEVAEYERSGAFLSLGLKCADSTQDEENTYWLPDSRGSYRWLQDLMPAAMLMHVYAWTPGKGILELTIDMDPGGIAFFTHISLVDKKTKKRILPVFCDDNYFTMIGGRKTIKVAYTSQEGIEPVICIDGFNTGKRYVEIQNEVPKELRK
ncbi:hypothetical protein GCM10023093_31270 [Nemorincola caseinilytica]|uniref:Glycosyl hydrolase n=1 Tax=Nemorincola caseinilytica TaxID=2054315 RepID=A0ABP8NNU9_9BACT